MEKHIAKRDYFILIYDKNDKEKYNGAIRALTLTKRSNGWDSVQGVPILKDCRIPSLYHGDDLAIIMERYEGSGKYQIAYASDF